MIDENELNKEKQYLKKVISVLESELEKSNQKVVALADEIKEELRYVWDYDNQIDNTEWAENMRIVELNQISSNNAYNNARSYIKMLKSAYFARIDFETEGELIPVYIGIATLSDDTNFYIYDWRAPIASMFYDYEKGEAQYTAPNGEIIKGKITLKRQYKIEKDKIVQIFDTDMQVVDDILKQMLQNNASEKMRNIVNTIQKEQNKIIRKRDVDILVVEGPAGSGKTSVAMHKIAYLLYAERKNINNSNILILSPNDIFSNYISGVLPEIGEDNVYQTTFMDYVRTHVDFKINGTVNDLYERVYSVSPTAKKHSTEYNSIMLKYGATYIHLIENYLKQNRNSILGIEDIVVNNSVIIDKEYLEKLANELDSDGVSLVNQGKKLIEKIILHLTIRLGKGTAGATKIKNAFEDHLAKINCRSLYRDIYSNKDNFLKMIKDIYASTNTPKTHQLTDSELGDIFDYTSQNLENNVILFEDIVGYLYLKDRIQGSMAQSKIKYVLIDEAQDYTIMQYKILAHLFRRANITILGDINQSIMPFATHQNYEAILNLLKQDRPGVKYDMTYLTKTYRSTYEINMFCKNIIGDENMYNQVDRHGDKVKIIADEPLMKNSKVFADAIALKKKYNTIAIITKTQDQANKLYDALLKTNNDAKLFKVITGKDNVFHADKISIIPSYLAKGLEFDAVLVYDASEKQYPKEHKNLFYVVCTRALHKLNVYHTGEPTSLIKNAK